MSANEWTFEVPVHANVSFQGPTPEDPPSGLYQIECGSTELVNSKNQKTPGAKNIRLLQLKIVAPEEQGGETVAGRSVGMYTLATPHNSRTEDANAFVEGKLKHAIAAFNPSQADKIKSADKRLTLSPKMFLGKQAWVYYTASDPDANTYSDIQILLPEEAEAIQKGEMKIRERRRKRADDDGAAAAAATDDFDTGATTDAGTEATSAPTDGDDLFA